MENLKSTLNKALANATNAMIDKDSREWPPGCALFAYQPVRPQKKNDHFEEIEQKQDI